MDDLFTMVTQGAGAAAPKEGATGGDSGAAVEKFGDVPRDQFLSALEPATGGRVKSLDDLNGLFQKASEVETWQKKYSELEQSAPKFSASWIEDLNKMVAGGADKGKLNTWWTLSNTDLEAISPVEALVLQAKMTHDGLSDEEARAYVLGNYGIDDGEGNLSLENLPAHKASALKVDALKAKQELGAKRADISGSLAKAAENSAAAHNPVDVVAVREQLRAWTETVVKLPAEIKFSLPANVESGHPEYGFSFNPKPEIIDAARRAVVNTIAQNPAAFPRTEAGEKQVVDLFNHLVMSASRDDFNRAMFLDVYASVMQAQAKANAGRLPQGGASGVKVPDPGKGTVKKNAWEIV